MTLMPHWYVTVEVEVAAESESVAIDLVEDALRSRPFVIDIEDSHADPKD